MRELRVRPPQSPQDVRSSNLLLRGLWATLRSHFSKLAWQFSPRKDGKNNRVYFGFADVGLKDPVYVGVTYRKRGIIDELLFENHFGDDLPEKALRNCVALAASATPTQQAYAVGLSVRFPMQTVSRPGQPVEITARSADDTTLIFRIDCYDTEDGLSRLLGCARPVADVLSAFTNTSVELQLGAIVPSEPANTQNRQAEGALDSDWLDGFPMVNGLLVIPEPALEFIDLIAQLEGSEEDVLLASACALFHQGLELDARRFGGCVGETIATEMAVVAYISALEVASSIGVPPSKSCRNCGQPEYKISARVHSFVEGLLGRPAADIVKDLYGIRSGFVHSGRLLSSRSFNGKIIPQLDPGARDGVKAQMPTIPLHYLREFTSYCMRSAISERSHAMRGRRS